MHSRYITTIFLVLTLSACTSIAQTPLPTEVPQLVIEPTPTELSITSTSEPAESTPTLVPTAELTENVSIPSTVLNFVFPFEPAPPGYLVNIKSKVFTANLMCAVENGEILNLDDSDDTKKWGECNTSSMTLNVFIPDQMTVTVILGGFPLVDEVTKSPDSITEQQAVYNFESSLK